MNLIGMAASNNPVGHNGFPAEHSPNAPFLQFCACVYFLAYAGNISLQMA